MERDPALDEAEAAALRDGSDTGWPASDAAVYDEWVRRWGIVVAQIQGLCLDPTVITVPTPPELGQTLAWYAEAVAAHQADSLVHPGYADWNQQWVDIYARLGSDYRDLYRWYP